MVFRYPFGTMKKVVKKKGFSLIEFLVSMSIIILLSALFLPQYDRLRKNYLLSRDAHKFASDLRYTQEMAISSQEYGSGEVPRGGYGVYLKENQPYYLIYADINNNQVFDSGVDSEILRGELNQAVKISDINPGNEASINFKPPAPDIKLTEMGSMNEVNSFEIIFSLISDSSQRMVIFVNKAGLIYVE